MGLTPGKNEAVELDLTKEGPNHRSYDQKAISAISYLKSLGERLASNLSTPSHRNKEILRAPIDASQVLLQATQEGNVTYAVLPPEEEGYLKKIKNHSFSKDQAQTNLKEVMFSQILRLCGYTPGDIDAVALRATLTASKFFDKGIPMKIGSFFLELFKIDKKHALKNKTEKTGRKDTICEAAGVYPIIRKVQAPDYFVPGKTDPLEIGAAHALRSLFTGTLQYAKDMAWQGGHHPDSDRDPNLKPKAIQRGAQNLFSHIRQHGFASLIRENSTSAKNFDEALKKSEVAQKCLETPSRCLVDPNVTIIPDEKKLGGVRFHAESPILTTDLEGLKKVTVRVFHQNHKFYLNTNMAEIGAMSAFGLSNYLNPILDGPHQKWKPIENMVDDTTRPVFALSITKNGETPTPRELIDNAGLNGDTLLHYDFRVNSNGTVDCITHHGHTRQDGSSAAVYSELQGAVLPSPIPDTSPSVIELATLYPIQETPQNGKELLNSLGLSDIAVGEGYNQKKLKDKLKTINEWYNGALSEQIFNTVSLELQDNANIDTFIASLVNEHPQVARRQNLYSHQENRQTIVIPPPGDELELLLDNLREMKETNKALQDQFKIFKQEQASLFTQIPTTFKAQDCTNPDELLKILGDNYPTLKERIKLHSQKKISIPDAQADLESLVDKLILLKKDSKFKATQASIGSIASLVRNLLSPNISEVHLFDMTLAARGGTVNCTLPLFDYLRLETSIVKRSLYLNPLLAEYKYLQNSDQKTGFIRRNYVGLTSLFADLEVNLLDQTLSRLGLPTAGFFLAQAGGAADQVAALGEKATPAAADISRHAYAQTSFVAGLGKFISALQRDMPMQDLAVSGTDDGNDHGYLYYRANLAKPESDSRFLNMLDINYAIREYTDRMMHGGLGLSADSLMLAGQLSISEDDRKKGINLSQKLDQISKMKLSDIHKKIIKDIITLALQQDLHKTITDTEMLSEMMSLYANQQLATD